MDAELDGTDGSGLTGASRRTKDVAGLTAGDF